MKLKEKNINVYNMGIVQIDINKTNKIWLAYFNNQKNARIALKIMKKTIKLLEEEPFGIEDVTDPHQIWPAFNWVEDSE